VAYAGTNVGVTRIGNEGRSLAPVSSRGDGMIDNASNPVAWALLIQELEEGREHLDALIKEMVNSGQLEEEKFRVDLGHIYAHLNRVWHSRNQASEITDQQWTTFSQFPADVPPMG